MDTKGLCAAPAPKTPPHDKRATDPISLKAVRSLSIMLRVASPQTSLLSIGTMPWHYSLSRIAIKCLPTSLSKYPQSAYGVRHEFKQLTKANNANRRNVTGDEIAS